MAGPNPGDPLSDIEVLDGSTKPHSEILTDLLEHVDDHTATGVEFTPAGGIAATNVQAAIVEAVTDAATAAGALDTTHAGAADPHTVYQKESEKAASGGYASLDGSTKVPVAQLPTGTSSSTVALGDAAAALIATHEADTTSVHGITNTASLETTTGSQAKVDTHAAVADPHTGYQKESEKGAASGYASLGIDGLVPDDQLPTPPTADAHDASAISLLDTGGKYTATDVEGALAEKGVANGLASLGADGLVPDAQLPTPPTTDAHDASAISVVSTTLTGTGTDVQAVLEELDNAIGSGSFSGDVTGAFLLSGDISPTSLSADVDDWAPTGFSTCSRIRVAQSGSRSITGLAGGADGRMVVVHNISASGLKLVYESASSTGTNRFNTAGLTDYVIQQGGSALLVYDQNRWRVVGAIALYNSSPEITGTTSAGTSNFAARGDHVHSAGGGTPSTQEHGNVAFTGAGAAAYTNHKHAFADLSGDATTSGSMATTVEQISGKIAYLGDISPTQLAANTNNWAPTGFSTASIIRFSTDASRDITGIAAGTDGRAVWLCNVGAQSAVLKHDVTSTAANRFLCPNDADYTITKDASALVIYDATSSRWRVIHAAASAGGGSDDQTAAEVPFTPVGTIAATDTQTAVAEVATDAASALTTHAAAGDPHAGYRLESANIVNADIDAAAAIAMTKTAALTGDVTKASGSAATVLAAGSAAALDSGTLSASRLPAHTGDATSSAGSAALTIANDAVTYAKMQNVSAASKLVGRGDSGSGDPQEITVGTGLAMTGTTLSSTGGAVATDTLWDAAGDLVQGTGADTAAKLAIGTPGQIPVAGAGAGAGNLGYANPSTWGYALSGITIDNFPRYLCNQTSVLASGTLRLHAINLPKNFTVTSISFVSTATAFGAGTSMHFWVALFDSSLALLRQSTDNTSGPGSGTWAANSLLTTNLSSTFVTTYAGFHYIGLLISQTGGTLPSYSSYTTTNVGAPLVLPAISGASTTGLTGTAPNPAAAITQATTIGYGGVA